MTDLRRFYSKQIGSKKRLSEEVSSLVKGFIMAEWYIKQQNLLNYVEVILHNDSVRTEAGALRYCQGPIEMKSKLPSLGGFIKSRLSGEKVFRPIYSGSGKLVLEPSFQEFYELQLNNESLVLDRGAFWACDDEIEVDIKVNKISTSLLSGEGLIQTVVKGRGSVIIQAPGPIEIIDLKDDRLVVDGSFAVARSASLDFSVQQSTRSLLGTMTSGEIIVNVLQGTGRVYLAPIPNHTVMLQNVILNSMYGMLAEFRNAKQ
jgi:uncharacterized protein (AIM24 family)